MEYITDSSGKWLIKDGYKILVEPSEEYIKRLEQEEQQMLEQEMLENLKPSEKEVLKAEIELNIINLLIESGVIR